MTDRRTAIEGRVEAGSAEGSTLTGVHVGSIDAEAQARLVEQIVAHLGAPVQVAAIMERLAALETRVGTLERIVAEVAG